MCVKRSFALVFLALVLSTANSVQAAPVDDPENQRFQQIYKLPVWIDSVGSYCRWKSPSGSGFVRAVRTQEPIGHGLYLQWIRYGLDVSATVPISTVKIEELGQRYKLVFEMPTEQLGKTNCTLSTDAEDAVIERRYQVKILLDRPGEYHLEVTSKLKGGGF